MKEFEALINYLLNIGKHSCIRKQAYKVNIWTCKDNINTNASRCENCELGLQMVDLVDFIDGIKERLFTK